MKGWFFWFGIPTAIGLLVALILPMFCINRMGSPELLANVLVSNLKTATKAYIKDCHQSPSMENKVFYEQITGNNLQKIEYMEFTSKDINANGEIVDSWQSPIKIITNQDLSIIFVSADKDKKFGTKDDISSEPLPINLN
ncbi:MAG: hypothetical protein LBH01_08575 [Verrucomicrobiales bacterium]|nr:hypothetical protein [Verrucomicrobiales bacterium]